MPLEPERRDFVRVSAVIPVTYRFRASASGSRAPAVAGGEGTGATSNLSGGGMLLETRLPRMELVTDLLTGRQAIDVELTLPGDPVPIRASGRVAWIETVEETTLGCHLGVRFLAIDPPDKERIFRYVIRVQMPV